MAVSCVSARTRLLISDSSGTGEQLPLWLEDGFPEFPDSKDALDPGLVGGDRDPERRTALPLALGREP
jgi:hypothetical protein